MAVVSQILEGQTEKSVLGTVQTIQKQIEIIAESYKQLDTKISRVHAKLEQDFKEGMALVTKHNELPYSDEDDEQVGNYLGSRVDTDFQTEVEDLQAAWKSQNFVEKLKNCTKEMVALKSSKAAEPPTNFATLIELIISTHSEGTIAFEGIKYVRKMLTL